MNLPSIKTLSAVFQDNAKNARAILEATDKQLNAMPACMAYRDSLHSAAACPRYMLRLHALNALDNGMYGIESAESIRGEYLEYLNAGDTYALTLIYWRGRYVMASLGGMIESLEKRGVKFL